MITQFYTILNVYRCKLFNLQTIKGFLHVLHTLCEKTFQPVIEMAGA